MLGTTLELYMNIYKLTVQPLWGVHLEQTRVDSLGTIYLPSKNIYLNVPDKQRFYMAMHSLLTDRESKPREDMNRNNARDFIRSSLMVWLLNTNYTDL